MPVGRGQHQAQQTEKPYKLVYRNNDADQKLMAERNADVQEDRRMLFRIGINLDDVLEAALQAATRALNFLQQNLPLGDMAAVGSMLSDPPRRTCMRRREFITLLGCQPGGGGVARGNPYRADRIRDCHRPGRRRLRREPGAAGRQHYRVHPLRIQHEREMAGTAQRDVSSSSSSSANAPPAALTVTMIASRRYLEAFRMFLPLGGTGSRAPVTPGG